ncbi:uncharacterized protein PADG_06065 [Paracoccidioides brasiliensis Pb18]|uniref:Rhodopsin domain-containing protein n=1 Tax=Paracoccidioides brasiliensis (strain Pb18) TaxID=502780 RepID=C1GFM9_PARBD|nr:uncharacterized protein PADG_06065 [Paracoccidioides brasiliensis Pb18]EEH49986.2 hypothetical protein PADG_06065 [Paracoccidioides brasiliensis Pb18]
MATSILRPLPPGVSEPLAADTYNDRGGFIAIITALCLGFALVSLGIRAYVQYSRHVVRKDDYVLLAATILFCTQSSVVFLQIAYGWGKSEELLRGQNQIPLLKATYAADMLFILTHCVSKSSAAMFYLRISPSRNHLFVVWGLVCSSVIWAVISMLSIALGCDHTRPWTDVGSECRSMFPRWQFIGAFDIITEFGLAIVSFFLVAGVQMPMIRKAVVVLAFSSRLLVAFPASFHLHYVEKMLDSPDHTLVGAYVTICLQLELSYGIMANTVPCLKPFMAAYEDTGKPSYRARSNSGNSKSKSRSSRKRKSSRDIYTLSTISSSVKFPKFKNPWASNSNTMHLSSQPPSSPLPRAPPRAKQPLGAGEISYTATVRHSSQGRGDPSLESDDSNRLIIKKDVNWNVECSKSGERETEPAPTNHQSGRASSGN